MVDKYIKSNWLLYIGIIFIVSRVIMYYQFNLANMLILDGKGSFIGTMCKWDCKWYLTIINNGYDDVVRTTPKLWRGLANWAFFPLYPVIIAFLKFFIPINPVIIGITLNQIFVFFAAIFLYKLLRLNFNDLNSRFGVTLLIFSPFSIYFTSLYTESLFLLLSVSGFYFLRTNSFFTSSVLGGLLSATRPVGIMFLIPIFISFLRKRINLNSLVILGFISSLGLLLFMLFLYIKTGDALAFQHIQKGWGRRGWGSVSVIVQIKNMASDYYNAVLFTISASMSIYLVVKKYYEEAFFNLACIMPGVLTGTMMSEGRFSGTLFTFYFALTVLANRSWTIKILTLIIFLIMYLSFYAYWVGHSTFLI